MVKENYGNATSIKDFLNLGGKYRDERLIRMGIRRYTNNEFEMKTLEKYYYLLANTDYLKDEVYDLFIEQKTHKEVIEIYGIHDSYMRNIVYREVRRVFGELSEDLFAVVRYGYFKEEPDRRRSIFERVRSIINKLMDHVTIKKTRDLLDFLLVNIEEYGDKYNEYEGVIDKEMLQETLDRLKYLSSPYLEMMFKGVDKRILGYIVYLLTSNEKRLSERDVIIKGDICEELFLPKR